MAKNKDGDKLRKNDGDKLRKKGPPIELDPADILDFEQRKQKAGNSVKNDPDVDAVALQKGWSRKLAAGVIALTARARIPNNSPILLNKSPQFRAAVIRARG